MFVHELLLLFICFLFVPFRFCTVEPESVEDVCEDQTNTEPEDPATVLPASDSGKGGYISYFITFSLLA